MPGVGVIEPAAGIGEVPLPEHPDKKRLTAETAANARNTKIATMIRELSQFAREFQSMRLGFRPPSVWRTVRVRTDCLANAGIPRASFKP